MEFYTIQFLIVYRRIIAISQTISNQYHTLDISGLRKLNYGNHGQGTHSTRMGAHHLAENTPNTQKLI